MGNILFMGFYFQVYFCPSHFRDLTIILLILLIGQNVQEVSSTTICDCTLCYFNVSISSLFTKHIALYRSISKHINTLFIDIIVLVLFYFILFRSQSFITTCFKNMIQFANFFALTIVYFLWGFIIFRPKRGICNLDKNYFVFKSARFCIYLSQRISLTAEPILFSYTVQLLIGPDEIYN